MAKRPTRKKHIIYQLTNKITGDFYIGVTERTLIRRWRDHCSKAKNAPNTLITEAISRYGEKQFSRKILERVTGRKEAYKREAELINKLKPSYNTKKKSIRSFYDQGRKSKSFRTPEIKKKTVVNSLWRKLTKAPLKEKPKILKEITKNNTDSTLHQLNRYDLAFNAGVEDARRFERKIPMRFDHDLDTQ